MRRLEFGVAREALRQAGLGAETDFEPGAAQILVESVDFTAVRIKARRGFALEVVLLVQTQIDVAAVVRAREAQGETHAAHQGVEVVLLHRSVVAHAEAVAVDLGVGESHVRFDEEALRERKAVTRFDREGPGVGAEFPVDRLREFDFVAKRPVLERRGEEGAALRQKFTVGGEGVALGVGRTRRVLGVAVRVGEGRAREHLDVAVVDETVGTHLKGEIVVVAAAEFAAAAVVTNPEARFAA